MLKRFENFMYDDSLLFDFLDNSFPKDVEELKYFVNIYFKHDFLSRNYYLNRIEDYYYGRGF